MKRVMCVWLPNWPIQRLYRRLELNIDPHFPNICERELLVWEGEAPAEPNASFTSNANGWEGETPVEPKASFTANAHSGSAGASPSQLSHVQTSSSQARGNRAIPVLLYVEAKQKGHQVVARSRSAAALGIQPGMPLVEANMLGERHGLQSEVFDPHGDRRALEGLAAWCRRFAPLVGIEATEPVNSLLLDLTGCGRLYDSLSALAKRIAGAFRRRRLQVRIGMGETIGAAWAMAHFGEAASLREPLARGNLSSLPVEALRLPPTTSVQLRELGLCTIGELQALPRTSLPARFGPQLLKRLDQATGEAAANTAVEAITPCQVYETPRAEIDFETAVRCQATIETACLQVTEQLVALLAPQGKGIVRLRLSLKHETHPQAGRQTRATPVTQLAVTLLRPSAHAQHLLGLTKLQLERLQGLRAVSSVCGEVLAAEPLQTHQRRFFGEGSYESKRQRAALLERLASRLGQHAVLQCRRVPDAQPEFAYRYEPLLQNGWESNLANEPKSTTQRRKKQSRSRKKNGLSPDVLPTSLPCGFRPLRLLPEPQPLEVLAVVPPGTPLRIRWGGKDYRIEQAWGPERIATGWWRHAPIERDYFRTQLCSGRRLWMYHQVADGRWFLHGWFD